jgi:hypothetical protein
MVVAFVRNLLTIVKGMLRLVCNGRTKQLPSNN